MVERFFAETTRNRIRRGAFKSVAELKSAIMGYLENHNADPKPFIWTKSAGEILEKVARAKQSLETPHCFKLIVSARSTTMYDPAARCKTDFRERRVQDSLGSVQGVARGTDHTGDNDAGPDRSTVID
jgi:hypothetical protein